MAAMREMLIPIGAALAAWFLQPLWPGLASKEFMGAVGGIFAIAWGIFAFALPKLADLTGMEGMTSAERDRLDTNVQAARSKIWRSAGWSLACSFVLAFLAIAVSPESAPIVAAFTGFSAGVGAIFLRLGKAAHDEIYALSSEVNRRKADKKERAELLAKMAAKS